ncbi:MAG: hypothetical protein AB7G11_03955 [Phycisphaerales bacterium]
MKPTVLRLASARDDGTRRVSPAGNAQEVRETGGRRVDSGPESARARIAAENESASELRADDARWMLARSVAGMLEGAAGGNQPAAARLRPERRRRVHELATRLGLRAFDANLIIAVVQDAAMSDNDSLSRGCRRRLTLVGRARRITADETRPAEVVALEQGTEDERRRVRGRDAAHVGSPALGIGAILGVIWLVLLIGWVSGV